MAGERREETWAAAMVPHVPFTWKFALAIMLLTVTADLLLLTAILYILLICAFSSQGSLITSMSMEHINAGIPINFSLARGIGSFAFAVLALVLGSLTNQYGGGIVLPVGIGVSLVLSR